jgi:ATP-dependent exoDNAse (exonuclease V) alpha subunit
MSFLDKSGDSIRIKANNVTFEGEKNTHITRLMFPFILSWAITIHKTQGLTIDKAVISLSGCIKIFYSINFLFY